jgi:hypothetical protein
LISLGMKVLPQAVFFAADREHPVQPVLDHPTSPDGNFKLRPRLLTGDRQEPSTCPAKIASEPCWNLNRLGVRGGSNSWQDGALQG